MPIKIPVVLGSVREGRKSLFAAKLINQALKDKKVESVLVDFKEMPLPFFYSALLPIQLKGNYQNSNVQKWSDIARGADAFVLIVPEYNHGYSAVLKNALDWLYLEFEKKPFGLVGVSSGTFAGARAIEQMRPIIENFSGFAIRETVMFGPVGKAFDEQGKLIDESYLKKIEGFLQSLMWFTEAMNKARV
jgi:azobenzene reductase